MYKIFLIGQGQLTPHFMVKHTQDFIVVLVTCKNEEDPIKNEGARVFTTLYIDFSDIKGQVTLHSVVRSAWNSNSPKLLCMPLCSARIKMIQSKMKALECIKLFHLLFFL